MHFLGNENLEMVLKNYISLHAFDEHRKQKFLSELQSLIYKKSKQDIIKMYGFHRDFDFDSKEDFAAFMQERLEIEKEKFAERIDKCYEQATKIL